MLIHRRRPDDDNRVVEAQTMSGGHLTSQDSNSPVDNSEDNSQAVRQHENTDTNICSQQHGLASTNHTKDKKRRGERGISMGYDLDAITKRNGSKMKIDFTKGVNRP